MLSEFSIAIAALGVSALSCGALRLLIDFSDNGLNVLCKRIYCRLYSVAVV